MKILVTNNGLDKIGGSETYSYTLIEELKRRGHEVHALAKRGPGKVSTRVEALGVPVFFKPIKGNYDLILASHTTSIAMLKNVTGFRVQTCHGIFPKVEQPVKGMDAYVAISEEVQNHLTELGYKSILIRNGVNCERYKPRFLLNPELRVVLSLSHSRILNNVLKTACQYLGIRFMSANKYTTQVWNVEDLINQADLVVSLGRGAYEAMACGRNVFVFDKREYVDGPPIGEGLLTKDNALSFLENNCSGRKLKKVFKFDEIIIELKKYHPDNGEELRRFAKEHLNIYHQVNHYLNLLK